MLVTGELIASRFGQNAWVENDRVVASVDLAIQEHILPGIDQSQWDLVIFDEAHKLAAYRYGAAGKIDKTKRYLLAERLATRTKHLLLLTATPHKGDPENFRLLMALLDDQGVRLSSRHSGCCEEGGITILPAPNEGGNAALRRQAALPASPCKDPSRMGLRPMSRSCTTQLPTTYPTAWRKPRMPGTGM